MKIKYIHKKFKKERLEIVNQAAAFLSNFRAQGYVVTLRQLYYKFISADAFPASWIDEEYNRKQGLALDTKNTIKNYKKLGDIVADGRKAGLLDWDSIEDRTRNLETHAHWHSPARLVSTCASIFTVDFWDNQVYRPEVWIEKDALIGIIAPVCEEFQVPYFAGRGYPSVSELQSAAQRLARYETINGQIPLIIHLGDHDPSGKDMTRDIFDRVKLFASNLNPFHEIEVKRIALNWDQIQQYQPPPNPAKATDSRYDAYKQEFGEESWELDALEPDVINELIRETIEPLIDRPLWAESEKERDRGRAQIRKISNGWSEVVQFLDGFNLDDKDLDEDEDEDTET